MMTEGGQTGSRESGRNRSQTRFLDCFNPIIRPDIARSSLLSLPVFRSVIFRFFAIIPFYFLPYKAISDRSPLRRNSVLTVCVNLPTEMRVAFTPVSSARHNTLRNQAKKVEIQLNSSRIAEEINFVSSPYSSSYPRKSMSVGNQHRFPLSSRPNFFEENQRVFLPTKIVRDIGLWRDEEVRPRRNI